MIELKTVTHLGDAGLILPLAAVILGWLAWRRPAAAVWWALAAIGCFAVIAVLKIVLFACSPAVILKSPSGHTANAVLVYGAIAVIAGSAMRGVARAAVFALAAAAALVVAATRVLLGAHTGLETALGFAVGGAALAAFAVPYLKRMPAEPRPWLLVGAAAAVIVVLHGRQIYVEDLLQLLGLRLRGAVPACA